MHPELFLTLLTSTLLCQIKNENVIEYESQGTISLNDCQGQRTIECTCTWEFIDAPSEGNDLILNMTQTPSSLDLVTLNGDPFDDKSKCIVMIRRSINFSDAGLLQSQYPGCKIRAGIQNHVIVTYQFSELDTPFTIEYQITGEVPTSPPDTTTSSTESVTSPIVTTLDNVESTTIDFTSSPSTTSKKMTSTLRTPAGRVGVWNLPRTYTIAIVVGSVAVALIIAVFVMLCVIRKRHKENIQEENRLNVIYDNDIPQYATVDDCKQIQNGKNGGFTKQDVIKEEVLNPLYSEFSDDSAPVSPLSPNAPRTQNSYEYIDIEIGNR